MQKKIEYKKDFWYNEFNSIKIKEEETVMVKSKVVTSLDKIFLKDNIDDLNEVRKIRVLKGERISYQIVLASDKYQKYEFNYEIKSKFSNIKINRVGFVPSECPVYERKIDEHYITTEPGLFPDVLYPVKTHDLITVYEDTNTILWITIDVMPNIDKGIYPVELHLYNDKTEKNILINIEVEDIILPASDLIYTDWLHTDCIASYYEVEIFSAKYWELVELFMKAAVRTGVNTIYTPIITPPLDTEIGGERPTVQLVDIEYKNDKYYFEFEKLEKWIELAKKNNIKYFEMAHLFTQWGAESTPKIVVKENGKEIKKFGWHVKANAPEYEEFLSQFLPSLVKEIERLGIKQNVFFHISDEPSKERENDLANYMYAKELVGKYLKDFKIIDALSNIDFYKNGVIENPIPGTDEIEPFLEENIEERWCYYCCGQTQDVSNRFIAMPSYRTRILGVQLYLYDMIGFLHWGFNFYYSFLSREKINPFVTTDGIRAYPSGDPFCVYPGKDEVLESIRSVVFYEGLQDRSMLKLLEDKIGKKKTKEFVNELAGETITFKSYPHTKEFIYLLKEKIIEELKK